MQMEVGHLEQEHGTQLQIITLLGLPAENLISLTKPQLSHHLHYLTLELEVELQLLIEHGIR